jgi:hypothetical protein
MEHDTKTVVVMADTHVRVIDELPSELRSAVNHADMVIHLGDFTSPELLKELQKSVNFHGIFGNHDGKAIHAELKRSDDVVIGGRKLGLIHGFINPLGSRLRMRNWFKDLNVDAILYGHSHVPVIERHKGMIFFNPGSVAGKFPAAFPSFGLMHINGSVNCEVIRLSPIKNALQRLAAPIPCGMIRATELWP